ncbi:flagellar hook-basal body complex protein [Lacrimispora sp.]|uniref:flagellar hook-basal body complex protein n=1 Tax=Lacrimispora sp. TaxID=2719234 RepID=UPI003991F3BD
MVKSMFAGVAGLRAHQSKMDVIGNNIANVNTWGYKAANMSFKDAMYQSTSAGSSGSTEDGGYGAVNANQIGYGVTTGSISYDFSTGGISPSNSGLDCMIEGTGFFLVGPMINGGNVSLDSEDAIKSSGLYLSRVGKFKVDPNGYLTDDSGNYVYGFKNNDINGNTDFDKGALSPLRIPTNGDMASVAGKDSNDKLEAARKKLEEAKVAYQSASLALADARAASIDAREKYELAYKKNGILDKLTIRNDAKDAADEAYSKWKSETDPVKADSLKIVYETALDKFELADADLLVAQFELRKSPTSASHAAGELTDAIKAYRNANAAIEGKKETDPDYPALKSALDTAKQELNDIQEKLAKVDPDSIEGKRDAAVLAEKAAGAKLDDAERSQKAAETQYTNAQTSNMTTQEKGAADADALAKFDSYKVLEDGSVVGTTLDSKSVVIGKIALGGVTNTGGLEKDSGYYYTVGASAGNVSVYEGGGTQGKIRSNALEMAKVDLATEMTDMITTQRGFQANSKIITVTDQMLEELVNMKR